MMKKFIVLICISSLTACAKPAATPINFSPTGSDLNSPAIIRGYESTFDKSDKKEIPIGAEIIEADGEPVKNLADLTKKYLEASNKNSSIQQISIRANGQINKISSDKLFNPHNKHSKIVLFEKNKTYNLTKDITGQEISTAAMNTDNFTILQTVLYWPTNPPMIEVSGVYSAKENCKNCSFDDLQVKDSSNAKLPFLSLDFAASTVYPDLGPAGQTVAVPAPTVTGYNAFSTTTGNIYSSSYGNNYYGNYSGFTRSC